MNEYIKYSESFELSGFSRKTWDLIFACLFILVSFTFNYQEILTKRPQGIHIWRQTDCTSMALNYHQKDLPLLHPQMHYRLNENAEAMGEFPLLYYLVGKLYDVFGYHEFIYRLFWLILAFIGSFSLYRLSCLLLNLPFESIFIGFLLMLSPVMGFYGVSFIADPVALFLLPPGFLLLYHFWIGKNVLYLLFSMLIISLSSLLKLSNIIIPLSLFGTLFLVSIFRKHVLRAILILVSVFFLGAINYLWYDFSISFNEANNTGYFLMRTMPFWEMSEDEISLVNLIIRETRQPEFYNKFMLILSLGLFLITIVSKKVNIWIKVFLLISLAGVISFVFLFYQQFKYHDYYMIFMLFLFPAVFVSFFHFFSSKAIKGKYALVLKFFILGLFLFNTYKASKIVRNRFNYPENSYYITMGYFSLEKELEKMGVEKDDYVISIPDASPNATLYLMNRSGWSNLYHNPMKASDIEYFKSQGAKYLIIGGEDNLKDPALRTYTLKPIGQYQEIYVFEL